MSVGVHNLDQAAKDRAEGLASPPESRYLDRTKSSVVDPKLYFSDPDSNFQEISDPDSDPDPIWIRPNLSVKRQNQNFKLNQQH